MRSQILPPNQLQAIITLLFSFLNPVSVNAYEVDTHARLSVESYKQSEFSRKKDVMSKLGLLYSRKVKTADFFRDGLIAYSLPLLNLVNKYFDATNQPPLARFSHPFDHLSVTPEGRWEETKDLAGAPLERVFPHDWLARGSVREDDASANRLKSSPPTRDESASMKRAYISTLIKITQYLRRRIEHFFTKTPRQPA
jgi:hypothetical protein